MRAHLLREISPPDCRVAKNQKERIKYTFTPKRIIGAIKNTLILFTEKSKQFSGASNNQCSFLKVYGTWEFTQTSAGLISSATVRFNTCQWGGEASMCSIEGQMTIWTPSGNENSQDSV